MTMKLFPIALAAVSISLAGPAMAAEVDMSKVTCAEVGALPAAKTIGVAMWVNGYVHGKAGNAMVDGDKAHANAEKLAEYCKANKLAAASIAPTPKTRSMNVNGCRAWARSSRVMTGKTFMPSPA